MSLNFQLANDWVRADPNLLNFNHVCLRKSFYINTDGYLHVPSTNNDNDNIQYIYIYDVTTLSVVWTEIPLVSFVKVFLDKNILIQKFETCNSVTTENNLSLNLVLDFSLFFRRKMGQSARLPNQTLIVENV